MPPIALLALLLQASAPGATSEALGGDRHRVTLTFSTADPEAGARRLDEEAARLCGARHPHFGQYRYEMQQALTGPEVGQIPQVLWRQEIECRDEPPPVVAPPTAEVPATAEPVNTDALQSVIDDLTSRFFAAYDGGDDRTALALTSPIMGATEGQWAEGRAAQLEQLGESVGPRAYRTTWYVDHPQAPPGLFAAVDFGARHERGRVCGFVGWFRPAGEAEFRMTSLNTTLIPDSLDITLRAAMEAQSRCVDPPPDNAA